MTNKQKTVKIDECIINSVYMDGLVERVTYAGMPSKEAFSLIFEDLKFKNHNEYDVLHQRQLYFPLNYKKEIVFPSHRKPSKFKVKEVYPDRLTAIIMDE